MPLKDIQVEIIGACEWSLIIGQKELCRCEEVKDLEMRGLPWIIWVDLI